MEQLLSILEEEDSFLLEIDRQLGLCEASFLSKDTSQIEEAIVRLEDLLEKFYRLEEERRNLFEKVKREKRLDENLSFFDFCKQDPSLMQALFKVVDRLKDLSHRIDRLHNLSEFHQAYFDFLRKLLSPSFFPIYDSKARLGTQQQRSFKAEG
ncbi:hypothetical protein AS159_08345 [Thermotoga sp. Ku-13t]|uniref:flagellar export chaperone FlgN n=1 Tax=Thermotoga sp. Ku-13t TaxID=1755813 RepID=UPI0013EAE6CD|nr:flagellar export chaperone FlgN [Thermotoga sp. Ku-13t]KAF2957660.1 hypothetical protein AS159_08345 [Thermotoga sp. Ku-13t]